jgi:RimJ/RimL family protein N-acetyltransferase
VKHDIVVEGFGYRLRPVEMEDAVFVLSLRTDPELARFLNPTSPDIEDQKRWTAAYFERPGDYYWVIESKSGEPEGTIAIYDVDTASGTAEWGWWIVKHHSMAATESALLIYTAGFERLHMKSLYCRTVADNERVVSFHASCGLETRRILPGYFRGSHDCVEQVQTRERWPESRARLTMLANRLAKKHGTHA